MRRKNCLVHNNTPCYTGNKYYKHYLYIITIYIAVHGQIKNIELPVSKFLPTYRRIRRLLICPIYFIYQQVWTPVMESERSVFVCQMRGFCHFDPLFSVGSCCVCLSSICILSPMLTVAVDCSFLNAPSGFSNVYLRTTICILTFYILVEIK